MGAMLKSNTESLSGLERHADSESASKLPSLPAHASMWHINNMQLQTCPAPQAPDSMQRRFATNFCVWQGCGVQLEDCMYVGRFPGLHASNSYFQNQIVIDDECNGQYDAAAEGKRLSGESLEVCLKLLDE